MPNSLDTSDGVDRPGILASTPRADGTSSLSSGWKRWKRLLRCTISAHLPDALIAALPYRPQRTERANWDAEYAGGHWDYLRNSSEMARYGIIASYCHCHAAGGALLDHGCGQGTLRRHLNLDTFSRYIGVDLSLDAVGQAAHRHGGERTTFVVGDVETFEPSQKFDAIVFNEILYYLDDPVAVMQRYCHHLTPNGFFVVSMFDMVKARKVWRSLDTHFRLLESARAVNQGGHSWTVRVYRP